MPTFGKRSLDNLAGVHPALVRVMNAAIKRVDFTVICGYRGKDDQEAAFAAGNTKVHYPNSAHNQTSGGVPRSCAVDVIPYPFKGWNDPNLSKELKAVADVVFDEAKKLNIEIRWGGDFNRDGDKTKSDAWDKPHFELHPWRDYASGKK